MTKILRNKSNIDLDYPICRPSLDLDFTQERLDPRITFSRGSIGTRVNRNRLIETVSANQPRFDYDPVTGECKGLLIEESRSNLFTYSDDAATAWGIKSGLTVSANTDIAPDGNQTMDTLVEDAARNDKYLERQITVNANQNITWSCYVKPLRRTNMFLVIYDGASYSNNVQFRYEFSNQTLSFSGAFGTGTFGSYSVVYVGNGVYRMVLSGQPTTSASTSVKIRFGFVNQSSTYTGTGVSAAAVWGAQLEAGAFPTSYIPTTASTVTRSADIAQITGTNFSSWYNQSEGTVYSNTRMNGVQNNRYDRLWAITNSNLHFEGISVYVAGLVSSGGYVSSITITNGATEQINGEIVESARTTPKLRSAFSFKTNDCASAYNGILRFVDKSAILLSNPDRLLIGQPQRFQGTSCMTISRLTYYPRALKPNQLQYLTQ